MPSLKHGHTDMVALLLDRGADINEINKVASSGQTPLDCAVSVRSIFFLLLLLIIWIQIGHTDMIALLIARGVDVNNGGFRGQSPLFTAAGVSIVW